MQGTAQQQRMQIYTSDGILTSTSKDSMDAVVCLNCLCIGHMIQQCTSTRVTLPDTVCRKHLAGMCTDPCPHSRRHIGHETAQRFVSRAVDGIMQQHFGRTAAPEKPLAQFRGAVGTTKGRQVDSDDDMEEAPQPPAARQGAATVVANHQVVAHHSETPPAGGGNRWAHAAVASSAARLVRRFPSADVDMLTAIFAKVDGDEEMAAQVLRKQGVKEKVLPGNFLGAVAAAAARDAVTGSSGGRARTEAGGAARSLWGKTKKKA
eukprot:Hpha_TRINITY_DN33737_c0_g1::TRINITY_DN33737_c0_g1_i1::g.25096::m.25096